MVTSLSAGDLAFVGYNADGDDDFAIVTLVDITAPLTVFFTDDEWIGASFNVPTETTLTWTTPAFVAAGTVITFTNADESPGVIVSAGTASGFVSLSSGGDSILAYQGTLGSPTQFVTGIAVDEDGFGQSGGTLAGTGLTVGVNALEFGQTTYSPDGGAYSGTRDSAASFSDYSAIINNIANWTIDPQATGNGELFLPFNASAFTVGAADTTPPLLASLSPTDGAVNVGLNDNLVLTFNEAIALGTGTITIRSTDDNAVFETISVPSGAVSVSGSSLTINPTGTFETATRYHIEATSGVVTDTAGNPSVGLSGSQVYNFSTVLPTIGAAPAGLAPGSIAFTGFNAEGDEDLAIVALEDLDGSVTPFQIYITDQAWNGTVFNTGADGTIIWTVDEFIAAGTVVNFSDLTGGAGSNTSNFTATHGFISESGSFNLATGGDFAFAYVGSLHTPSAFLAGFATDSLGFTQGGGTLTNTGLVEGVTAANFGVLEDGLDGASYTGDRSTEATFADYLDNINAVSIGNYSTVNGVGDGESLSPFTGTAFATAGIDTTPPGLLSVSPLDETSGVAVGANLSLTFNENVQVGTGNITIFSKVGDTAVAVIDVTSGQVTVSGGTVTINPTADLDPATAYYVQVDAGAIEDTTGNDFAGIANETDWNFSTQIPTLTVPTISAGAVAFTGLNVDGNEDLAFTVLEDLNGSTQPFQMFFTDTEWNGTSFVGSGGTLVWTVTTDIAAGTVVNFTDVRDSDTVGFQASVGLLQEVGSFDITSGGDVIYAYVGTAGTPATNGFLGAIATDPLGFASNSGGLTNTGLTDGITAVSLSDGATSPDGAAYNGARDTLPAFADYAAVINTASNWTLEQTDGELLQPFSSTSFTEFVSSPPTATGVPTDVTVTEDLPSDLNLSSIVLADAEGDALTATLTVTAGTFATPVDGAGVGAGVTATLVNATTVTLVGSAADINTYLDTASNLQYTGVQNAAGDNQAVLSLNVNDGTSNPLLGTINIDITPVNDDPIVSSYPVGFLATEDEIANIDLSGAAFSDVDSSGDLTLVLNSATGGTFTAATVGGIAPVLSNGDQTVTMVGTSAELNTYFDVTSNLQYTGGLNVNGANADTISGTLADADGSGPVAIPDLGVFIIASNDPASATGVPSDVTVVEDTLSPIDLSSIVFEEVDGQPLTVTISVDAGTFGPLGDGAGIGSGVTETTVSPSSFTLAGTPQDINTYLDTVTNVQYLTELNASGPDQATMTISANDGSGATQVGPVSIDVTPVNDVPTLTGAPAAITVLEDTASNVDLSALTFEDIDGDALTVTLSVDVGTFSDPMVIVSGVTATLVNPTTITLAGTVSDINAFLDTPSNLQYTAPLNAAGSGQATITVNANDTTVNPQLAQIAVDVTPENDAPTVTSVPASVTVVEDQPSDLDLSTVFVADVDTVGNLTLELTAAEGTFAGAVASGITPVLTNSDSTITLTGTAAELNAYLGVAANVQYTTALNDNGTPADVITGSISDGTDSTSLPDIDVNVTPVDDLPTLTGALPSDITVDEATAVNVDLSGVVLADEENDLIQLTIAATVATGALTVAPSVTVANTSASPEMVTLQGTQADLNAYLANANAIQFTGAQDVFGTGASTITYSIFGLATAPIVQGTTTVNITDVVNTEVGGATGDALTGGIGADNLSGEGGNDTILGGDGNDTLRGGEDNDRLNGEDGDDLLAGNGGDDTILGREGADTLFGGAGDDVMAGNEAADVMSGGSGNDRFFGNDGNDTLDGDAGNDTISGGNDDDLIRGGIGNDYLRGVNGNDMVMGGDGDDAIAGNTGNDTLEGEDGNDSLFAGSGADRLIGGAGTDEMTGSVGADVFVFSAVSDSAHGAARDTILDFAHGEDQIDLSSFGGLTFIGTGAYSNTAGEVRYNDTIGRLYIDTDGDGASDFSVDITGAPIVDAGDLLL